MHTLQTATKQVVCRTGKAWPQKLKMRKKMPHPMKFNTIIRHLISFYRIHIFLQAA